MPAQTPRSTTGRSLAALLLAVTLSAVAPHAAFADGKTRANQYFKEGTKHYSLAEYTEALESFKAAFRERPDAVFLFNTAQCYRQLGDKEQALTFYRSYLRSAPDAPNRVAVEEHIAELTKALDEEHAREVAAAAPPPVVVAPAPVLELTARPPEHVPVTKRRWFWPTVVGGAVVVGLAIGLGVGLGVKVDPHASMGTVVKP